MASKIFINNKFYSRDNAKISVFDSGFLLGDGVWSGIRYHNSKFLFLWKNARLCNGIYQNCSFKWG